MCREESASAPNRLSLNHEDFMHDCDLLNFSKSIRWCIRWCIRSPELQWHLWRSSVTHLKRSSSTLQITESERHLKFVVDPSQAVIWSEYYLLPPASHAYLTWVFPIIKFIKKYLNRNFHIHHRHRHHHHAVIVVCLLIIVIITSKKNDANIAQNNITDRAGNLFPS